MKTARTDNTSLIPGCAVTGDRGLGVLGRNISSVVGPQGTSPLYDSLDLPADNDVEVRWRVHTWPMLGGVLRLTEDGKLYYAGPPDTCVIESYKGPVSQGTATLTFSSSGTTAVSSDLLLSCTLAALVHADLLITPGLAALVRADLLITPGLAALVRADLQLTATLQSSSQQTVTIPAYRTVTFEGGKRTVTFPGGKRTVEF